MDARLDIVWLKLMALVHYIAKGLDFILAPLNPMGPSVMILAAVVVTVAVTKFLSKIYKTKRYVELKKEFDYWFDLRKEAMAMKDTDQGKALAKNIDQARLNSAYYNFFFEGLLGSLLTKYLPVFLMLAYVNETFKSDNLLKNFGQAYIFKFVNYDGEVVLVGAVFWYVVSILLVYLAWFFAEFLYGKYINR
ncbi:MAG: hypothetical protein HF978_03695 [Desulfobacteraceae bacterium]|nr:hypothetical protein [Desulfobacteraceae bacterium]MBC2754630.1 hypothetical protein [Desulfobacteraceae bacterium]